MAAQHTAGGDRFQFWPFLFNQAIMIHNSLPTRKFKFAKSPDEAAGTIYGLQGEPHVMLCKCYVAIPPPERQQRDKLDATGYEASYLGWDNKRQGHYVYIHCLNRITTVRSGNVRFPPNEDRFLALPSVSPHLYFQDDETSIERSYQQTPPVHVRAARFARIPMVPAQPLLGAVPIAANQLPPNVQVAAPLPTLSPLAQAQLADDQSADLISLFRATPNLPFEAFTARETAGPIPLPKDDTEALSPTWQGGKWLKDWKTAMLSDMEKKIANGAYKWADIANVLDKGFRVHGGKWVFAIKYKNGVPIEFRARWVFKGFTQRAEIDYDDTFIGAISGCAERCMIGEAARQCLPLYDCDVRAAFTTAKMDRELYFDGPRPFTPAGKCAQAVTAQEGSKQAGNLYYNEHSKCFTDKMQCERCTHEPNLYRRSDADGKWIIVGVLTDNCLLLPSDKAMLERFLTEYRTHYTITGGDMTTKFNGMQIDQSDIHRGIIRTSCSEYIQQVHDKYLGSEHRPRNSPVDTGKAGAKRFMAQTCAQSEADRVKMADKDYLGALGCASYVAHRSRPDCTFYTAFSGQFMQDPSPENYDAVMTNIAYMHETKDLCITYGGDIKLPQFSECKPPIDFESLVRNRGLMVHSDASHSKHKYAGWVIMYMNAAICWASRKIKVATTSTTESEVCAGVGASKDLKFTRNVLAFMWAPVDAASPVMIDNEGMWFNVRNSCVSQLTRHWEDWEQFVRECYAHLMLTVHKVNTHEEWADILTKAIPKEDASFKKIRNLIMNIE
jgi:hypothetical protein